MVLLLPILRERAQSFVLANSELVGCLLSPSPLSLSIFSGFVLAYGFSVPKHSLLWPQTACLQHRLHFLVPTPAFHIWAGYHFMHRIDSGHYYCCCYF